MKLCKSTNWSEFGCKATQRVKINEEGEIIGEIKYKQNKVQYDYMLKHDFWGWYDHTVQDGGWNNENDWWGA